MSDTDVTMAAAMLSPLLLPLIDTMMLSPLRLRLFSSLRTAASHIIYAFHFHFSFGIRVSFHFTPFFFFFFFQICHIQFIDATILYFFFPPFRRRF